MKGYGVLALREMPPDTIICSYRGQIKSNDTVERKDDSLWDMGWINLKNVFVSPLRKKNIGRFINSSNSSE